MLQIQLTQGKVALIDDRDLELVSQFSWVAAKDHNHDIWYAQANIKAPTGTRTTVTMHRLIMSAPKGKLVDHRNGDGLDNQRSNLRFCTHAENSRNMANCKPHSSRFKGVSWHRGKGRWTAQICTNRKLRSLGAFDSELEAAAAYNAAAKIYHGEFARLNELATA